MRVALPLQTGMGPERSPSLPTKAEQEVWEPTAQDQAVGLVQEAVHMHAQLLLA